MNNSQLTIIERPMLYSPPMVKALLDNRKTNTRRLTGLEEVNKNPGQWNLDYVGNHWTNSKGYNEACRWVSFGNPKKDITTNINVKCPYGKPGDVLWVRENLYQDGELGLMYVADKEWIDNDTIPDNHQPYRNFAHCTIPNIHMPKWASRIWLRIEEIKIERLQSITEEDAVAEGVESWIEERMRSKPIHYKVYSDFDNPNDPALYSSSAAGSFETLWRKINGKDSWALNPWVWVVKFKVLSTTGRPKSLPALITDNQKPKTGKGLSRRLEKTSRTETAAGF